MLSDKIDRLGNQFNSKIDAIGSRIDGLFKLLTGKHPAPASNGLRQPQCKRPRLTVPANITVPPAVSPAVSDQVTVSESVPDTQASPSPKFHPNPGMVFIPANAMSYKAKDIFLKWLLDQWYCYPTTDLAKKDRVKLINLKLVISFFSMFLPRPVPALPSNANGFRGGNPHATSWRKDFEKVADGAWKKIQEYFAAKGIQPKQYDSGVKFRKLMYGMARPQADWPSGINLSGSYLHTISAEFNNPIRTKADILADREKTQAASVKRKVTIARNKRAKELAAARQASGSVAYPASAFPTQNDFSQPGNGTQREEAANSDSESADSDE
jgi:hypothetical protein